MCFFRGITPVLMGSVVCCIAFAQTPAADLYVSPNGNDSWSGTLPTANGALTDGPFASVPRAQAALWDIRKSNPERPYTVMLRGGNYYLPLSPTSPGTLTFSAFDSGTTRNRITWQNYPGETPVISGGVPIGKSGLGLTWKHLSGDVWQVQLPGKVQPFEYLFYN